MAGKILQYIPEWAKRPARSIRNFVMKWGKNTIRLIKDFKVTLPYRGKGRWCPVCEKSSKKFKTFGNPPRKEAECIFCGALERHRFAWLYFNKMTNLFDNTQKVMLHVAPERWFEPKLREQLGQDYITADLFNSRAMVQMNITNINYPDEYFDVIYCSHVLEHVQNDRQAMAEFYRVLKKGGWAILLVPITAKKTFEDLSITDPSERLRVYGQEDHVRRYGPDYVDRLREAGFKVKVSCVSDIFEKNDILRMGLTPSTGEIYYCTKE